MSIDFQHGLKLVPQILVFLIALLGLATYTTGCKSHDEFTVLPDLEIPIVDFHRRNDGKQLSTVVSLLTSRQGEGAVPVIVDAEAYTATCSSEPRVLVADACSIGPGNDTVMVLGFPLESRV